MNRLNLQRGAEHNNRQAHVIALMSGKGGVGKSVIAFNLAERMAAQQRRVLLVDADLNCGNQHILANVTAEYGIGHVLQGKLSLREALLNIEPNCSLLASVGAATNENDRDRDIIECLFNREFDINAAFDAVIIDCPSGISPVTAQAARLSEIGLLVVVPELTSIADAYALFKQVTAGRSSAALQLLLNRVADESEAAYLQQKFLALCERFIGAVPGFAGWLPEEPLVRRSVASQQALAAVAPDSQLIQSLEVIARRLTVSTVAAEPQNRQVNTNPALADIGR